MDSGQAPHGGTAVNMFEMRWPKQRFCEMMKLVSAGRKAGIYKGRRLSMGKPFEPYLNVLVESYRPSSTAGLHGSVHIRPVAGHGFAPTLHVRCSKKLSRDYPVGTRFLITAKLTDREGGGEFLHSHHSWTYQVIDQDNHTS